MKKKLQPKVHKVLLEPGYINSRYDGDRHLITGRMLMNLYGVLPTDIVQEWSPYEPSHRKESPSWGNWEVLTPLRNGEYYDIHALDEMEIDIEATKKAWDKIDKKYNKKINKTDS